MRRLIVSMITILFFTFLSNTSFADWEQVFGGVSYDSGNSVRQTADGGFIIVGQTRSYGAGQSDIWLIKTDSAGARSWDRVFGGASYEQSYSVEQTTDGGYIIGGSTASFGAGDYDGWLIKIDSSGDTDWDQTYGTTGFEYIYCVQETADGGFVFVGYRTTPAAAVWLVKTDSSGNFVWERTFGGTGNYIGRSVRQTSDGGYIIVGEKSEAGPADVYLMKADSSGNKVWEHAFGQSLSDYGNSVEQTSDGGYIIAGSTEYSGGNLIDAWLIRTDSDGNLLWDQTFGGVYSDYAQSVRQTEDGGFAIAASTFSYGAGSADAWLIKTDPDGVMVWDKTFGGASADEVNCVQQTSDGAFILAGNTFSYGSGANDIWLIKAFSPYLSEIHLLSPEPSSVVSSAPEFVWTAQGGADSVFAVDVSPTPTFVKYYSTYNNMHKLLDVTNWQMPLNIWNRIPHNKTIYWRVRGADLARDPLKIITSAETWSFYKP